MSDAGTVTAPPNATVGVPRAHVDRFAPGVLVAGRYRIVAFVGRGGMGEVYRAHDVRIDQPVALKFLPARLESKPEALDRFRAELRLGRQVSHPNVCRLYDLGEHEGRPFLTMEYVDGEDLASLLERMGALPLEKVVRIARDVAAGLAAAHAIGIVHRDLKPSNVMIDGKGRGRISDFGLAIAGADEEIEEIVADLPAYWTGRVDGGIVGTPAYMAPEQLAGAGTTPRSDVYAFGLLLYECLTGRPFHGAGAAREVIERRLREGGSSPSLHDLDPSIGGLLRSCLDTDPQRRPASGQSVLAALPGDDPLAAAVAAGETPSPEVVAAAEVRGGWSRVTAWSLLATMILAAIAFTLLSRTFLHANIDGIRSPRELTERAAAVAARFAGVPRRDASSWLHWDLAYVDALPSNVKHNADWRPILNRRPTPVRFTYRESPRAMVAGGWRDNAITADDPPLTVPGMSRVTLDPHGRLRELVVVPPDRTSGAAESADWPGLFALAELPAGSFHEVAPEWSPPVGSDERRAWMGTTPGSNAPLRVEAAARAGRPVWFSLIEHSASATPATGRDSGWGLTAALRGIVPLLILILAFFNLRPGRGDRRGARRLAFVAFATVLLERLVRAHYGPDGFAGITAVPSMIGMALFAGIAAAVAYLALEPFIRRYDPEALISWIRLIHGRLRDPLVGRHLLIGLTAGTAAMAIWCLIFLAQPVFGLRAGRPIVGMVSALGGPGHALFWMLRRFEAVLTAGIDAAFLLVVFRAVVRKRWVSYVMLYAAFVVILMRLPGDLRITRLVYAAAFAGVVLLVLRVAGVLGVTALAVAASVLPVLPLSGGPNAFHAGIALVGLLTLILLAALATICSLGRTPVVWA